METVAVAIPTKFKPLLTDNFRYKLYYGGRAGGKSYAFADRILLKARKASLFIACVREIQESIKDSVHKLLSDRISYYGFDDFKVYDDKGQVISSSEWNVGTGYKAVIVLVKE